MFDHQRRRVRMQIETGDKRHLGTDQGPHPSQQLTLAVFQMLRDHGAVQAEIHGIIGWSRLQSFEDQSGDMFESVFGDHVRRRGSTPRQWIGNVIERLDPLDETGDRQVLSLDSREQVRPGGERRTAAPRLESIQTRFGRCESVCFVLNAGDRNKSHVRLPKIFLG